MPNFKVTNTDDQYGFEDAVKSFVLFFDAVLCQS